jgi:hypothetical protein
MMGKHLTATHEFTTNTVREMKANNDLLLWKPFIAYCAAQCISSPSLEIGVRPEDGYRHVCLASTAAAAAAAFHQRHEQSPSGFAIEEPFGLS